MGDARLATTDTSHGSEYLRPLHCECQCRSYTAQGSFGLEQRVAKAALTTEYWLDNTEAP